MSDPTFTDDLLGPQPVDSAGALVPRHREWKFSAPLTCAVVDGQVVVSAGSNFTATWAQILTNGASSGATDPVIATGQKIRGQTSLALEAPTGSTIDLQINNTSVLDISSTRVRVRVPSILFAANQGNPALSQADDTTDGATADTLLVQAQNATGTTSTGAALDLRSGTGTTRAGYVYVRCGSAIKLQIRDTGYTFVYNQYFGWADTAVSPILYQLGVTSGNGKTMTLTAQATTDVAGVGGTLALRGAAGGAANGSVVLGCHTQDRLTVTPTSETWSY